MLLTDVDGVLTDGGMYYTKNGDVMKKFHARDGMGVNILLRNNDASINVDYQYNVVEGDVLLETFPNTAAGWRNYSIQDFNLIGNFSHHPTITINDLIFNS